MRCGLASSFLFTALLAACSGEPSAPPTPPAEATESMTLPDISAEDIRAHVAYLADDSLEGRAPGTAGDVQARAYIERVMRQAGLEPGFGSEYQQPFEVTDGVRVRPDGKTALVFADKAVTHSILPFSADTGATGAVTASSLVFVGHGIPRGGKGTGDYEGLDKAVDGSIVVALHGSPEDPHLTAADTRPQSKVIAAREHGAAGFILWDPQSATPWPNHGEANNLGLPAVFVGADANEAIVRALVGPRKVRKLTEFTPEAASLQPGAKAELPVRLETEIEPIVIETANVGGRIPGNGSSDRVVVVGAHLDHLGMGTSASLAPGAREIHNGADDNASGVAAMLETCRALALLDVEQRPYEVYCVGFGAEEMGLLGSKHMVENLDAVMRDRIAAMLNFDMVGRLTPEGVIVGGAGTAELWPTLLESHRGDLTLRTTADGHGPSDHASFYEIELPVLHFFTGPHEDYHKPSDDLDKLDYIGAAKIAEFAGSVVLDLMQRNLEPQYLETKQPTTRRGGFRVSLGTMPDYAADVDGVRLSGVRAGGPAQKAGLAKGDVIKKLGEREIHNLDDYMAAFARMAPGETIEVVVEREGETLTLQLTPAAPR